MAGRRLAAPAAASLSEGLSQGLVSVEWLKAHRKKAIQVVDASWFLGGTRDGRAEFEVKSIPGSVFFDVDQVADASSPVPHTLPSDDVMAEAMAKLGIGKEDPVVAYDSQGIFSSPRLWYTLRYFGHEGGVAVLDGGLPAWTAAGLETVPGAPEEQKAASKAASSFSWPRGGTSAALVWNFDDMSKWANGAAAEASFRVVDARSAGRFAGTDPEPRAGLRGGHIPGSLNVPFSELLETVQGADDQPYTQFRSAEEVSAVFEARGVDLSAGDLTTVTTCGSGMTACVVSLALHLATGGNQAPAVYDGSWSEWGASQDAAKAPVVTGSD